MNLLPEAFLVLIYLGGGWSKRFLKLGEFEFDREDSYPESAFKVQVRGFDYILALISPFVSILSTESSLAYTFYK